LKVTNFVGSAKSHTVEDDSRVFGVLDSRPGKNSSKVTIFVRPARVLFTPFDILGAGFDSSGLKDQWFGKVLYFLSWWGIEPSTENALQHAHLNLAFCLHRDTSLAGVGRSADVKKCLFGYSSNGNRSGSDAEFPQSFSPK
jgi:hypothetical protein